MWLQLKCWKWLRALNLQSGFQWVDIKKVKRAIEKLRRTHFGIVRDLSDVVRASLVVDNFHAVHKLLFDIIVNDTDVKVVRGKNRKILEPPSPRLPPLYPILIGGGLPFGTFCLLLSTST